MINIPIDDVWVLWPTTICSSFPEDPGNLYLNGKKHFKLELDLNLLMKQTTIKLSLIYYQLTLC